MILDRRFWPSVALCFALCTSATWAAAQQIGVSTEDAQTSAGPQKANDEGRTRLPMEVRQSIGFREIGPAISGGRVAAVAGVPGNSETYYVGGADGGVFRTDDGGMTWKAFFQHQDVASIGALAVDPVNPSVVWAGTGEANLRNDVSLGDGIYKSTDAGAHWQHMGLKGTFHIARILIDPFHPNTVLVAATGSATMDNPERGVFRTTDGGATWHKVLYINAGTGIADLAMDPKNPQTLFAAAYTFRRTPWSYTDGGPEDAIYKSTDGGSSWQRLRGHGLPTGEVTRIGLAVAPSSPNVVYAVIGSPDGVLWRSGDSGEHWSLVSKNQEVDVRPFYFSHITVDPKNPDHVIALSNNMEESYDGGQHFHVIARDVHGDHHTIWMDPSGSGRIIEGNDGGVILSRDNGSHWAFLHSLAIGQFYHVSTTDTARYMVCGGLQDNSAWCGMDATKDPSGILDRTWFTLNGGDGMFAVPASDNPDLIYNSTQNQALMIFDRKSQQVHDINPYPRDYVGGGVADLPYRFAWDAGFAVSPQNPRVLYAGGNVLFKSEDRGHTWKPISPDLTRNDKSKQQSSGGPILKDNSGAEVYDAILAIAPSEKDPNVIWVGTDDGEVQVTRDGGAHWNNVTGNIPALPEWGRVESVDLSPDSPGEAVIAVDRHFSGDLKPYLFRTSDFGATWQSITGDLPDMYAHVVRRDLRNPRMYYAGLENGLYVTWDSGAHWYLFGLGLPNASVYDIALQAKDNDLVVATHGRSVWVLDDLAPFQQFTPAIGQATVHLFTPPPAQRFWEWSQVEALGAAAFYGKNPVFGADLTYFLAHAVKEPGKLVITDAQGHVVRTLKGMHELEPGEAPPSEDEPPPPAEPQSAGAAKPEQHEAKSAAPATASQLQQKPTPEVPAQGKEAASEEPKEIPWVPTKAGLQRLHWDLRADGPVRWEGAERFNRGPRAGAMVPPGEYTATLTVGGETVSQKLEVVNDADSTGEPAAMEARFHDAEGVLHQVSQLDLALNRMDAIDAQLKALRLVVKHTPDEEAVGKAIDTLEKQRKAAETGITSNVSAAESVLRTPNQIRGHLMALLYGFEGSDDAPSPALLDQRKLLDPQYTAALEKFNNFLRTDVAAFNSTMAQHKLTGVVAGEPIQP